MFRGKAVALAFLLAAAALAGCVDAAGPQEATPPAASPLAANQTLPPLPPPAPAEPTADDWFHLNGAAAPGGALVGAAWTIPPDAMHERDFGSVTWYEMYLEVAPLADANTTITQWALLVFEEDDNESAFIGGYLQVPIDVRDRLVALDAHSRIDANTDPFFLRFAFGDEDYANRTLHFVLAAESPRPANFDLAWRILDEPPDFGDRPVADAAAFLESVSENRTRHDVDIIGQGAGFHFALYLDVNLNLFAGPGIIGFEARAGPVTVDDRHSVDTRPMATIRDVRVSTAFAADAGWTYALGLYWGDNGAAQWSVDGDVHGKRLEGSGTTAFAAGIPVPTLPLYAEVREGQGGAATAFELDVADINEFEIFELLQLSLGATLANLTGFPAQPFSFDSLGESAAASVRAENGDLVLEHGQAPWLRIGGLGAFVHETS